MYNWLGRSDSNTRMTESESVALPLGDAPIFYTKGIRNLYLRYFNKKFHFLQAFLCRFIIFFKSFFFSAFFPFLPVRKKLFKCLTLQGKFIIMIKSRSCFLTIFAQMRRCFPLFLCLLAFLKTIVRLPPIPY